MTLSKTTGPHHAAVDILIDLRCLQDDNYRERGIGRVASNLLARPRDTLPAADQKRIVGIVDPQLPSLDRKHVELLDAVRFTAYTGALKQPTWFVEPSPMTHDPLFVARLLQHSDVVKAAVVHDFIPLDEPGPYLPNPSARINYYVALHWLRLYDLFLPNSDATSRRLRDLVGVAQSKVTVIGAPVDPQFETLSAGGSHLASSHVLVVGGDDPRKNVEVAVRAHAACKAVQDQGIGLTITGYYSPPWRESLFSLYKGRGGRPDLLTFSGHVSEDVLPNLYRTAICLIGPSRSEGFSLPIVEAMAAGVPVIASDIPPHAELIQRKDLLFERDDDQTLTNILERMISDPLFRQGVLARQSHTWQRFRAPNVAHRMWSAVVRGAEDKGRTLPAPAFVIGKRPKVALLSPLPPDHSGIANYSAATCSEFGKRVELHVFSETVRPAPVPGALAVRPLSELPHISSEFDRVVSVVGNAWFHASIFKHLCRHGGACICHDARLLGLYNLLGEAKTRHQAEQEIGRGVKARELSQWLADESTLPVPLLGEVAQAAEPFFVHSSVTARLVMERYGVTPIKLPFCIRKVDPGALTKQARQSARAQLGIRDGEIAIATFGFVGWPKAPEECLWALNALRGWNINARLFFVGEASTELEWLTNLVNQIGLANHVVFTREFASEALYQAYLSAADVAIQLRRHQFGSVSAALADCIASGLPTVANEELADAIEAPAFVRRVPDELNSVLVAKAVANIIDNGEHQHRSEGARRDYSEGHNFRVYAQHLLEALAIGASEPRSLAC